MPANRINFFSDFIVIVVGLLPSTEIKICNIKKLCIFQKNIEKSFYVRFVSVFLKQPKVVFPQSKKVTEIKYKDSLS